MTPAVVLRRQIIAPPAARAALVRVIEGQRDRANFTKLAGRFDETITDLRGVAQSQNPMGDGTLARRCHDETLSIRRKRRAWHRLPEDLLVIAPRLKGCKADRHFSRCIP